KRSPRCTHLRTWILLFWAKVDCVRSWRNWRAGLAFPREFSCRVLLPILTLGCVLLKCLYYPQPGRGSVTCLSRRWRVARRLSARIVQVDQEKSSKMGNGGGWYRWGTRKLWRKLLLHRHSVHR